MKLLCLIYLFLLHFEFIATKTKGKKRKEREDDAGRAGDSTKIHRKKKQKTKKGTFR
jgi:hypothetical protein